MKIVIPQAKIIPGICLVATVVTTAGLARAQEDTQELTVPHMFEAGDVISADQMNSNFAELVDAINAVSLRLEQKDDSIQSAGIFAGSISTTSSGGNFSLLPGSDGAVGLDAADAACEVAYPGSHAVFDSEQLWKFAIETDLTFLNFWKVSDMVNPRRGTFEGDCQGWTSNDGGRSGAQMVKNTSTFGNISIDYDDGESCRASPSSDPDTNEMPRIACFLD